MAEKTSLEIRRAENAARLAKMEITIQEKKDDLRVGTNIGATIRYSPSQKSVLTNRKSDQSTMDESYALQASQTIFDFGKSASEIKKYEAEAWVKQIAQAEAAETLAFKVARAYTRVLSAQAIFQLAHRQMENAAGKFEQVRHNYSKGLRPEYDVVRAESDLGRYRIAVQKSQDELAIATQNLRFFFSQDETAEPIKVSDSFRLSGSVFKSKDRWLRLAQQFSKKSKPTSILLKESQRATNSIEMSAIDAKILPNVSLSASAASTRSTSISKMENNDYSAAYTGVLSVSWEIPWNQAFRDEKMRVSLRDFDLKILEEQDLKYRREKAQSAAIRIEALAAQSILIEKQQTLVSRYLSIVKQKYETGKASATELSIAEDESLAIATDAVRIQTSLSEALLDLAEAYGETRIDPLFSEE
jgi:outer membrane protein TolC